MKLVLEGYVCTPDLDDAEEYADFPAEEGGVVDLVVYGTREDAEADSAYSGGPVQIARVTIEVPD